MKKLVSLLLALLMVMGMATAFAEETEYYFIDLMNDDQGSITVANPVAEKTYTAYQIFGVTYDADKANYAYKLMDNSCWKEAVEAYVTEKDSLTLTPIPGYGFSVVEVKVGFSAADFAQYLKTYLDTNPTVIMNGQELTGDTPSVVGLALGYYFVTSTSGSLCNLTTTNPDATIYDKNDIPFDKKADDVSVEVGQKVNFEITGEVPSTTGYTTYTYEITDTMTEGLTFNKDVKVFVDGVKLTANHTIDYDSQTNGFVLTIDVMAQELQAQVGKAIKVTYTATVNEAAVTKVDVNTATLKYSNNPNNSESFEKIEKKTITYTAKVVVDKYAVADETKKLAGASFVLYKKVNEGVKYYKYDETTDTVSWVDNKAEATVKTTDENGVTEFIGLEDGTYYLEETEAPDGYNMYEKPLEVVIDGENAVDAAADVATTILTNKVPVPNDSSTKLPETGGMGTTLLYAVGGVLMLVAFVLIVSKRRASEN